MANKMNENAKPLSKKELRDLEKKKKRRVKAVLTAVAVVVAIGVLIGLLILSDAFEYKPQATYHVAITVEGYGAIHVELYGNDAPGTVEHFLKLVEDGYYNGKTVFRLFDDLAYMGDLTTDGPGIEGEFSDNGFNNRVSHERGVLSMAKVNEVNSAHGQFFIVKEDSPELDGKYAAFGKVTGGMEIVDKIFEDVTISDKGYIKRGEEPKIRSITGHESHTH